MCSLIHGVNARNQWRLISSSRPLTTVLSINRQLNYFPITFPYNLPIPPICPSTSKKYMSTATQRLKATSNHFQSQVNMAANNFYSVVAGVGAGTGMSIVFQLQLRLAKVSLYRTLCSSQIRKDIPCSSACQKPRQLRIHRQRDQSRWWPSNWHRNRCLLRVCREERLCRDRERVQGKEARCCHLQCWRTVCPEAVFGFDLGGI
jgi:hypothetical protein